MSYPYPQDRHRDRKEKGDQPYEDAKEAFTETQAQIQRDAEAYGEAEQRETAESLRNASPEERKRLLETAMEEQLDETTEEIMARSEKDTGHPR
jgi:hypothetical protein